MPCAGLAEDGTRRPAGSLPAAAADRAAAFPGSPGGARRCASGDPRGAGRCARPAGGLGMNRHTVAKQASQLHRRLEALNEARELAAGALPEETLDEVLGVLERASSRRSLSADHTVVGFFGATGSGKSSLFNAVSGEEIATAAARRPTTSEPLAGIWGAEGSDGLLDWLDVRTRHHAAAVPGFADETTGLILLDLPDFDSTRPENREIVQRMVGLVDVLVWVLDPQKYADAAVHNDFLAPLASHAAVTLVVLNQVDRLPEHEIRPVLESLKGILARDGLGKVQVLGASAVVGTGVDKVRSAIRQVVMQRLALSQRLAADVEPGLGPACRGLGRGRGCGRQGWHPGPAGRGVGRRRERAAGGRRGGAVLPAGSHAPHWLAGDALAGPVPARSAAAAEPAADPGAAGAEPYLAAAGRGPGAGPHRRCCAGVCGRRVRRRPGPWRAVIRSAAREGREQLPDALDQAIAGTDLKAGRSSWWWTAFNVVQWLGLLVALGGLGWLGVRPGWGTSSCPCRRFRGSRAGRSPPSWWPGECCWASCWPSRRNSLPAPRRVPVRRPPGNGSRPRSPPSRRNWWWIRWNWRSAGSSPSTPRFGSRQADGRSVGREESRGVADLDQGPQVTRGGAGLVLRLGGKLAEGAVQGAAGGGQPSHGFWPQPRQLHPVQSTAGVVKLGEYPGVRGEGDVAVRRRVVRRIGAGVDEFGNAAGGQHHHPGVVAEGFPQAGLELGFHSSRRELTGQHHVAAGQKRFHGRKRT